jgi:cytosine/adenosine deaminase-related metal-dependent hydrolase
VWPYEAALDADAARASAELGCAELLLGGTTAILDMGTVHWQDEIFAACERAGIRALSGKAMMDRGDEVPAGLRETTRASLDEAAALAARWHGAADGRLRYAYAPRFALSCSEELLRSAAAAARAGGMRLHTHASENRDECAAVRAQTGLDNVAYFDRIGLGGDDTVLAHGVWVSEAERALLARAGTHVVHCPSANLKLASGIAEVPELLAAGVSVALGADGAPCNNNLSIFNEMRLAALIQRPRAGTGALPARKIVELATLGGARALGLEREIGSIEVGKRADLCVVDASAVPQAPLGAGDPYSTIVFASSARDVRDVLVDGRFVVQDATLTTLPVAEVVARARAAAARMVP